MILVLTQKDSRFLRKSMILVLTLNDAKKICLIFKDIDDLSSHREIFQSFRLNF